MTKPELIIQDVGGFHNADLNKTSARLMKGGSWKKQRIITIIPSASMIAAKVVLSWLNLAYPPNNGNLRILALGQEVGEAYSNAIDSILENPELRNWEFICTIETDNMIPSDGILKLVEEMEAHPELAAISGLYSTKGYGGVPQIWGDVKDPVLNFRPQLPDLKEGVKECCGLGMGFALYRLEMFKDKKLRRPFFKTQKDKGGIMTQDLYFWSDARKHGYRCGVSMDVRVGHYDLTGAFGIEDFTW